MRSNMPTIRITPVFDQKFRGLCIKPYPLHPHGCPNFGKAIRCPPAVGLLEEVYDLQKPSYTIYNVFDLDAHVGKMRRLHPNWSERQLYCCLYWQGKARKELKSEVEKFHRTKDPMKELLVTTCPEAMGLNVTETMRRAGIKLEWPPVEIALQVAFAGIPRIEKT
jgi:predicted metal-binding protein